MADEQEFEVVDRRRNHTPEPPPAEDLDNADDLVDEDDDLGGFPPINPLLQLNVGAVLRMTLGLLNDKAWISLGLYPDPITNKVEKNLPEARRAIDAIADLVKHVELDAAPEEKRELQVLLSNLRLNYVQQTKS